MSEIATAPRDAYRRSPSRRLGFLAAALAIAAHQHQARALRRQYLRGRQTDARGRTGDDAYLAVHIAAHPGLAAAPTLKLRQTFANDKSIAAAAETRRAARCKRAALPLSDCEYP